MKLRISITLILFAIGLLFVLISLIPLRLDFEVPHVFKPTGIILLAATFIYGFAKINTVILNYKNYTRISSQLTPIYKFYFPTIFIVAFVFNTSLICFNIYPGDDISIFFVLEFMFIIWIILAIPNSKLHMVCLYKNNIVATNYINKYILPSNDIKCIERYFVFFYSVTFENEVSVRKIIFLPQKDVFPNLFITPKSVQKLKALMK